MIGLSVDVSRGCLWLSWTSTLPQPPPPAPPSVHPSLPPQLHSEGLANMNMLTYMIRVGPRAFRGKTASVLSSPLSLNSVMTAGWLKYTEGLNHLRPYKSYERDPPPPFTLRTGGFSKKERKAAGYYMNVKSSHVFCTVFMN